MSSQNVYLTDMPDLVMRNILEQCGLFSILNLKKVCKSLREFIDYSTPQKFVISIALTIYANSAVLDINMREQTIKVTYGKFENGCVVLLESYKTKKTHERKNWMPNESVITIFCNDFDAILKTQGSVIGLHLFSKTYTHLEQMYEPDFSRWERIKRRFSCFRKPPIEEHSIDTKSILFNSIQNTLKSRVRLLQVDCLVLEILLPEDAIKIIRLIDPKQISILTIDKSNHKNEPGEDLDILEIGSLEHWKNLGRISIDGYFAAAPMTLFNHIRYVNLTYRQVSYEDLLTFKQFFSDSIVQRFDVQLETEFENDELTRAYGQSQIVLTTKYWCFQIPGTDQFVLIHHITILWLRLERKTRQELTLDGFRLPSL